MKSETVTKKNTVFDWLATKYKPPTCFRNGHMLLFIVMTYAIGITLGFLLDSGTHA